MAIDHEVNLPVSSVKKDIIDFELKIEQPTILNKNLIVNAIINDLINTVINIAQIINCESCNAKLSNLESLKKHMRKYHEPLKMRKKCTLVIYVRKYSHIHQT